jgi:adenosylcobinamide-phosphate synthase
MNTALILALALALDATMGEPKWLWSRLRHPAVMMGNLVGWLDQTLNKGEHQRAKGIAALGLLAATALIIGALIAQLGWLAELITAAILLAQRSLVDHVKAVSDALRQSLPQGRAAVAMIVSRDTANMDASAVSRSAIESAAENLSDGVIAPAFWFLIGGLPALLLYKITNTADSMIGYRTPRHLHFGWAAARFDDLLNLIPARLTALLIAATHGGLRHWPAIMVDARLHRSPNAGWPESALSRALDIALAGPRSYDGKMHDLAWVNASGRRPLGAQDIDNTITALWRTWAAALALTLLIALF